MRVSKEIVVLVLTGALIGGLFYSRNKSSQGTRGGGGKSKDGQLFEDFVAPDLGRVEVQERDPLGWDRDPFTEPSDTRPLPLLALDTPPLANLPALLPPGAPALGPKHFHKYLRRDMQVVHIHGLFAQVEADEGFADSDGDDSDAASVLRGLGYVDAPVQLDVAAVADRDLTTEERAKLVASWRRLYDSIRINEIEVLFGQIRNPDRLGLKDRAEEDVLFLEVDPRTGLQRYPGQEPVPYERERVLEFAFAETVENEIAQRRREIGSRVTPGQFPEVMAFAESCVEQRLEAPNALPTAKELYTLLSEQFPDDPTPRLGRARTLEAEFDLQGAYSEYVALRDGGFESTPEVYVGLGELEARLRLFESALENLTKAETLGRTSWRVQYGLGHFLLERGEIDAALEHLELAHKFEPSAKNARVRVRRELGRALTMAGRLREAKKLFGQVLSVDDQDQAAWAGLQAVYALDSQLAESDGGLLLAPDQYGFELLVSDAVHSLATAELNADSAHRIENALMAAAERDPLRAWMAWRALSYLAERTGHPAEAYQFIENALEANPVDAWSLYQRARLLQGRDDPDGAREAFAQALSLELEFPDALTALGDLAFRSNDFVSAERYFERALQAEPERAELHARNGFNELGLNRVLDARDSFDNCLSLTGENPVARAGLAWCQYRSGDSKAAIETYAELDDLRRNLGEEDNYRLYARGQLERLADHSEKVMWTDRFERRVLRNGWNPEEMASPTHAMVDGQLVLRGAFERRGQVRFFRTMAATRFVSIEAEILVGIANNARVGLFVSKERSNNRGGGTQALAEVRLARHRDGPVQFKVAQSASETEGYQDILFPEWPKGTPVRVRIEREGEGSATTGRIVVDDFTVLEGAKLRTLFSSTSDLRFGLFVEGDSGRNTDVSINIVEVVHRK